MFGLLQRDLDYINMSISKLLEIEIVIIFGSRAMGNYKKGSDIDLAILGDNISSETIRKLNEDLNEQYPIPYFFDILDYNEITNKELKKHIDVNGIILFEK